MLCTQDDTDELGCKYLADLRQKVLNEQGCEQEGGVCYGMVGTQGMIPTL